MNQNLYKASYSPFTPGMKVYIRIRKDSRDQAGFLVIFFDGDTKNNIFVSSKEIFHIFLLLSLKLMRDYPVIPCGSNRPPYYSSLWNKYKQGLRAKKAELDSKKVTSSACGFWFRRVKHTDTSFKVLLMLWNQNPHARAGGTFIPRIPTNLSDAAEASYLDDCLATGETISRTKAPEICFKGIKMSHLTKKLDLSQKVSGMRDCRKIYSNVFKLF